MRERVNDTASNHCGCELGRKVSECISFAILPYVLLVTSDLSVITTCWTRPSRSQVIPTTDGFTRMAFRVRVPLVVCNRTWCYSCCLRSGKLRYPRLIPTVVSHEVFKGVEVKHFGLVSAEDLGSGTKVIGEVDAIAPPHGIVPTQVVDFDVKRNVVGRPVPCQHSEDGVRPVAFGKKCLLMYLLFIYLPLRKTGV